MKRITLGFVAFLLTFGVSTALVGLIFGFPTYSFQSEKNNLGTEARSIKQVIEMDIRNGTKRRIAEMRLMSRWNSSESDQERSERMRAHASVVDRYAQASSSIDVSNTPRDFQKAWNKHMNAWQKQAVYRKSMSRGFDNYSDNTRSINETWEDVLSIAADYGVPMKQRYWR